MLAYIILIANINTVGIQYDPDPGILVLAIQSDKAASKAGLEPGDQILKIKDNTLGIGDEAVNLLVKEIQQSSDKSINIEIMRNNTLKEINITPQDIDGKGTIGAQLQPNIRQETYKPKNILELLKMTNYMDKELFIILMANNTQENSKMENDMAKELFTTLMEQLL